MREQFHLRVYCVASGALTLYIYTRILALFSASPYVYPVPEDENKDLDLTPHLTNTSLQINRGEEGVRFLDELVGCDILSLDGAREGPKLTSTDLADIVDNLADVLAETFRAALENPVHFQVRYVTPIFYPRTGIDFRMKPLPNAFELYGVDFLVTMPPPTDIPPSPSTKRYHVKLLEVNAEPAIELTGARLTWILQDLFSSIGEVCVGQFFGLQGVDEKENVVGWDVGQTRHHLRKCLEVQVRGSC
jgi:tubulin---tyrosine ligase